ncbi:MerR family transcriptional regulator [Solibacillus sp. FSL R7-0682]|uniref:MerR family transcriptional regulator n=1 Tax=Solibacillus sp. FSL R7-0682 TaxID=2921690 RepID=UPI0030F6EBBC
MYIKEFALKYHLSNDAIRFYEKEGLLHPVRLNNGYRFYDQQCESTIKFILVLKKLGFSLQEINSLLKLGQQSFSNECNIATASLFANKITAIEKQIELYSAALVALKTVEQLIDEGKYEENKSKTEEMVEEMYKKMSQEEDNHVFTKLD